MVAFSYISDISFITTFNQLGFPGISDKPDGWYIPVYKSDVAIILETKNSGEDIGAKKYISEVKKNCSILMDAGYAKVVGILHNGYKTAGFLNNEPKDIPNEIQDKQFYIDMVNNQGLDKQKIFDVTRSINNNLHTNFGVKNLYHRMIFTACALVAERYGARLESLKGMDFSLLHTQILNTIHKSLEADKRQNDKLHILEDVYSKIEMNYTENQKASARRVPEGAVVLKSCHLSERVVETDISCECWHETGTVFSA